MVKTILEFPHCRIILAEINESAEELMQLLENFSVYEKEFSQINASKRKKEFLSVRVLVNILLQKNVIVSYNNVHKPYLLSSDFNISISHSGNYMAVITSREGQTGIDIERRTGRVSNVKERYLDSKELSFMAEIEGDTRALEIAWSAKEALFKLIGKEAYDFKTIKIRDFVPENEGIIEAEFEPTNQHYQLHYLQNQDFTLVYCVSN